MGVDTRSKHIMVNANSSGILNGDDTECGFVVKINNGGCFFEYSMDDIGADIPAAAAQVKESFTVSKLLREGSIDRIVLKDEPLVQSFARPTDLASYSDKDVLSFVQKMQKELQAKSEHILNAMIRVSTLEVSKLFVSANRELDQNYTWINGFMGLAYGAGVRLL